jgi:hypothetical protein
MAAEFCTTIANLKQAAANSERPEPWEIKSGERYSSPTPVVMYHNAAVFPQITVV